MGLFDDLLKKPPQPTGDANPGQASGTGNPPQGSTTDPLINVVAPVVKIEKTGEQSILTDSITPLVAQVSVTPTADPIIQNNPVITVETDASSILVNGEAILTPTSPVTIAPTEVAPVQPTTNEIPVITSSENPAPVVIESTTTTEEVASSPVISTESSENVNLGNLFGDSTITTDAEVATILSTPETQVDEVVAVTPTVEDTSILEISQETDEENPEAVEDFLNLDEYIQANIEQTNNLIARIDASHTEKLEEAAGYKSEKERFAELETNAYNDAEKMMIERAHAERMKTYFVEQLNETATEESITKPETVVATEEVVPETPKITSQEEFFYDEPPPMEDITLIDETTIDGSVETALTGLAVQNTVKKTIEKKVKPKKKEESKEFSLI